MVDFESDIKHLVSYYEHLVSSQEKAFKEMEEITKDILRKKEEVGTTDLEDFIFLEEQSFIVNFYQQEIVKAATSIKTVYRLAVNDGKTPEVPKEILDKVINNGEYDLQMYVDTIDGDLKFKDTYVGDGIKYMCRSRVDPATLEERFNMLKEQYDEFLKMREQNERKKADS